MVLLFSYTEGVPVIAKGQERKEKKRHHVALTVFPFSKPCALSMARQGRTSLSRGRSALPFFLPCLAGGLVVVAPGDLFLVLDICRLGREQECKSFPWRRCHFPRPRWMARSPISLAEAKGIHCSTRTCPALARTNVSRWPWRNAPKIAAAAPSLRSAMPAPRLLDIVLRHQSQGSMAATWG